MLKTILHPTDFSLGSDFAFAHALRVGIAAKARLTILLVHQSSSSREWTQFAGVRTFLSRWGMLPEGSTREAVSTLGVKIRKKSSRSRDPIRSIMRQLRRRPVDLIVVPCGPSGGFTRWARKEVAGLLAQRSRTLTLFVPENPRGFVSLADGTMDMSRVLVAVDRKPDPQVAVNMTLAFGQALGCEELETTLLHVGEEGGMPPVETAEHPGWTWHEATRSGNPVDAILQEAAKRKCRLIVVATRGRVGLLNTLRGSTTERLLRETRLPILAVPVSR